MRAKGCEKCNNKGMKGRVGVHEVIVVNQTIEDLILSKPSDDQINMAAIRSGMSTLRQSALHRVDEGTISLEEAIRIID